MSTRAEEHRAAPRCRARIPIEYCAGDHVYRGAITELSSTGASIAGASPAAPLGARIELRLPAHRRRVCSFVRPIPGGFVVRFDAPI
jgi:hypothetical protein